MDKNQKVSIIVPVYHAENFIAHTIATVQAQTRQDWELLLVLDGGGDRSEQIIEELREKSGDSRIKVFRQPQNMGAAKARNRGVQEATGRFIAYLDADDLWHPQKLEKQLAFMAEKQAAFSFTGYEFADESGVGLGKIVRVPEVIDYQEALKNTTIFTTTVMFDTKKIDKALLEMPCIKSEDTALWWKVLRNGYQAYGLDENLAMYRRAGKSLSSNKVEAIRRIWNLYRKAEKLSVLKSAYCFCFWAYRAVRRRV